MKNLRIGDKLVCKIDYWTIGSTFHKDREYYICDIRNKDDLMHNYKFVIKDIINIERLYVDYSDLTFIFYSNKEVRKMKLNKIYEEAES